MLDLSTLDCRHQRVIVRVDYNVPMQDGRIMDDQRLRASLPTLRYLLDQGAQVTIISHLGRPLPADRHTLPLKHSLKPAADYLSKALGLEVAWLTDWPHSSTPQHLNPEGSVALAENLRYLPGEEDNDPALAKAMAAHCDLFVMDAFASAHRAHASTEGIMHHAPRACAGLLLAQECAALAQACQHPTRPVLTIVGGAKVSTKLHLLHHLLEKTNTLIPGGGIANTLLAAQGVDVGASLCEQALIPEAQRILAAAQKQGVDIPLPVDARVVKRIDADAAVAVKAISDLQPDDMMVDIGPDTERLYSQHLARAATILWNGPVGIFEMPAMAHGTRHLAQTLAAHPGFTLAGGGDTVAAVNQFGVAEQLSYVSTGGGAFLQYLEGTPLPSLVALAQAHE